MISIKIKNHQFKSPILVASGTYGYGHEVKDIAKVDDLGGIVTKSVTLFPREGNNPPRISETSSGMLNSIGLANVGVENFCSNKIPYLNKLNTNIIFRITKPIISWARLWIQSRLTHYRNLTFNYIRVLINYC